MKIIDVKSNTPDWHAWRMSGIGASDAATVLGCGYLSEYQLYQSKLGLHETPMNVAMQRGHDLEPIARQIYIDRKGVSVSPKCAQSDDYPFMIVSFDGISDDHSTLVEIKTGGQKTLDTILSGNIPEHHYAQCQHQLAVSDLQEMDYAFFDGCELHVLPVKRDNAYINKLIKKEKLFWDRVLNFDCPEPSESDFEEIKDPNHLLAVEHYTKAVEAFKTAEAILKQARDNVIHLCNERSMKGGGVTIRKSFRKGLIDYTAVPELKGVDLDKYRKKESITWTIR